MAMPPSRNWFRPNGTFTTSNASRSFSSGSTHTNSVLYTGSQVISRIRVKVGTSTSVTNASNTTIGDYTANGTDVTCQFTKSSSSGNYYLFFQFLSGTTNRGYLRMTLTSFGAGTYTIYMGSLGVSTGNGVINNIMIISGTTLYSWDSMQAPIAYTGDYSAGSSDTTKSVILYNTTNSRGQATMSNGKTLRCPLWSGLTSTYTNGQAVRWCDIDEYNVTSS